MSSLHTKPELLAPAGDWEAMRAAVANGADAVYFGLSNFNARARATNFELSELPDVMTFLHARNVRGFVTLNTLIFSDELEAVAEFVKSVAAAGTDAVIVQDLGLVRLIKRIAPTLPVHGSTQMTLTEPRGIEFVTNLGVERVVLARELSLSDIRKVTANTSTPVEVFVHGALCVAYSGQCLTSEALGGRSANRGQCAQACRLPYEMIVDGTKRELGDRAYLLSPQDLAAFDLIDPLIEAGVISFKIEGRLKGGPYVASTTQTYRKAIDAKLTHHDFALPRREQLDLAQTFSRGLTPGFLEGVNHQMLVRGRFPKSRGVRIGRVSGFAKSGVRIELCEAFDDLVKAGDGVLFDIGKPQEQEPGGRVWRAIVLRSVVELYFEDGAIDFSQVPVGCDVYKTDDPALRKRLEQSYSQDKLARRVPITGRVSGAIGGALMLSLSDGEREVSASWSGPLELARKQPTSEAEIRDQLARLGDTPFELGTVAVELPAGVMVPRSVLNDLRRQAAGALAEQRIDARKHVIANGNALSELRREVGRPTPPSPLPEGKGGKEPNPLTPFPKKEGGTEPNAAGTKQSAVVLSPSPFRGGVGEGLQTKPTRLTVLVRNLEQLDAVLSWSPNDGLPKPSAIYADFEDLRRYKDAVAKARAAGVPIGLAPVRVWKPGEDGFQALVARAEPDIVLVRNLASISYFREQLPNARLIGDFSLNVANELTAGVLMSAGFERLVPSYDLNWDQFASMVRRAHADWFEPVVHQHMPMFHMEHCVFAAFLSTGKDHRDCGRPCEVHKVELRDRVGANFPVLPDTGCRNTVFNSVAQSAAEYVGRMRELGLRTFRVDLLRETPAQVVSLLERYARVIAGRDDGHETWRQLRVLNQLGVTRGTLQVI
ncbi:putative protease YhbU precursor [Gemmata sp. SH-PL17]|uniref:U32 family peptidase n=1 Tax=Gemmata sp. SH-PL17 TaxID=1630693 RepID=UPI00078DE293|nr:U32 family peptidase [Gemmata sp. SH-PL17]AMV23378.1 putative protease YhbU precursor [Gemmata sp. SH-PL17]